MSRHHRWDDLESSENMINLHSPVLPNFPDRIAIETRHIGAGEPCYIIAEAGSNHDRNLEQALKLVDVAADAGCDAVKFQTFEGDDIAAGPATELTRLPPEYAKWGKELRDFYKACALPAEFHAPIAARAAERKIQFFSSPFSEKAVDLLFKLGVPALKIASFEIVHLPLIRHAAQTGLPLIMSTGLAGLGDIEKALEAAEKGGCKGLALLHCGSNYPLTISGANLAAMETLRRAFGVPVGYSDHTEGVAVPTAAVALGASLLEKHFTTDRAGEGPDHSFALEPADLRNMVSQMRDAQLSVGSARKRRVPEEESHARRGRRSLVAARNIKAGERLTADAVKVVRPGSGLEPLLLDVILNRPVTRDISLDHPLSWDDFLAAR
ncbi:MAG: N-acetylneuraminate synthase family protein [Afipia sp.]